MGQTGQSFLTAEPVAKGGVPRSSAARILVVTALPPAPHLVDPLRAHGHEVRTALNGGEVRSLLQSTWRPELAIFDAGLPDPILRELFAMLENLRIPVLQLLSREALGPLARQIVPPTVVHAFLNAPFTAEDLRAAVDNLLRSGNVPYVRGGTPQSEEILADAEAGQPPAVAVAAFSPVGGVGKTIIAASLAACLAARAGTGVLLADCDCYFGGVAAYLNLAARRSWSDALPFYKSRDPRYIAEAITPYSSGLLKFSTILAPADPLEAELLHEPHLTSVLTTARRYFDCIIADLPVSYDGTTLKILDVVDLILVVTTPEVGAIHNLSQFREIAALAGYNRKIRLILNRANSGIGMQRFEALGWPVLGRLDSAGRLMMAAAGQGRPFFLANREAQASRQIAHIADQLGVGKARRAKPSVKGARRADIESVWGRGNPRAVWRPSRSEE
jgi:Flp pilus assembly CpaE family ATPase